MRTKGPNKFNKPFFNLRCRYDLSQERLAMALGVSRNLVWSIETGDSYGKINFWIDLQKRFNIPDEEMWQLIIGEENGKTV